MSEDNALPAGKTCRDCIHAFRCEAMEYTRPGDAKCYYMPSRFKDVTGPREDVECPVCGSTTEYRNVDEVMGGLERENALLRTALERIRDKALDHPMCNLGLYESRDIDRLADIGGDECDWTMIAIDAGEALND